MFTGIRNHWQTWLIAGLVATAPAASSAASDKAMAKPAAAGATQTAPIMLALPPNIRTPVEPSIAAASPGGVTQLWLGYYSSVTGRYEVRTSIDEGATWSADTTGGLIELRGDSIASLQFLLASHDDKAYVLDTGSSDFRPQLPSRLYRYDGSSWSDRNHNLPFRAPSGAALHITESGAMAVAWNDVRGRLNLWISVDEGLTWSARRASGGFWLLDAPSPVCLGNLGSTWVAISAADATTWESAYLQPGSSTWTAGKSWPWDDSPTDRCASDGRLFWIGGTDMYGASASLSYVTAAGRAYARPRSVANVENGFISLAATNGKLYGITPTSRGYELWKLR